MFPQYQKLLRGDKQHFNKDLTISLVSPAPYYCFRLPSVFWAILSCFYRELFKFSAQEIDFIQHTRIYLLKISDLVASYWFSFYMVASGTYSAASASIRAVRSVYNMNLKWFREGRLATIQKFSRSAWYT